MTSSGLEAPKIAVPATMTLLPAYAQSHIQSRSYVVNPGHTSLSAGIDRLWANTTIYFNIFVRESSAKLGDL